jgi:hypothetical protein
MEVDLFILQLAHKGEEGARWGQFSFNQPYEICEWIVKMWRNEVRLSFSLRLTKEPG